MQQYDLLIALVNESDIFDKQYALYCAVEKACEGLPQMSLADFLFERIESCVTWYQGFDAMKPEQQLKCILHNTSFNLMLSQEKCLWRL